MPPEEFDFDSAVSGIASDLGVGGNGEDKAPAEGRREPTPAPAEEPQSEQAPAAEKPAGTAPAPAPSAVPEPAPVASTSQPPDTWTGAAKAKWATIPPDIQAEIHRREGDIRKGLTEYGSKAKLADAFVGMIQPYQGELSRRGINAGQFIPQLLNAYSVMAWGEPAQKIEMFQILARDAGLDMDQLAKGVLVTQQPDPRDAEIRRLQDGLRNVSTSVEASQRAELEKRVDAFSKDPAHPYFEEVADYIADLFKKGAVDDLQEAYDLAVWRNPVTRLKEQQRVEAEAAKKAQAETDKKIKKVQKATAANVRSSEAPGGATARETTLDETLAEALADIKARE